MLKKLLLSSIIVIPSLVISNPALSGEIDFNPTENCTAILKQQPGNAALWTFGYLAGLSTNTRAIDDGLIGELTLDLAEICAEESTASFVSVVEQLFDVQSDEPDQTQSVSDSAPAMAPTSADPQILIDMIEAEGADLHGLFLALQPTPEDVRALFAEPLASEMIEMYEELFGTRLASEEFPSPHVADSSIFTTTGTMASEPIMDEIAGGFKQVAPLYLQDVPFGTITVGFPTEGDDMRLDGFVYVNGHWVLMMSPWRAL